MLKKYDNMLNLDATIAKKLFESYDHPWEVLPNIKDFILEVIPTLGDEYKEVSENVYIHKDVSVAPSACIVGPTIICKGAEIRHCAYIRGKAIIGKEAVVGNSTEIKNSILFDNAKCPHYNYVGDSILGEGAHTGAGVILSNLKSDGSNINIKMDDDIINTSLRKIGGILGNNVDVGCNCVIFPGSVVGENTVIYPLTRVRGVIKPNMIVKDMSNIVKKEIR